MIYYVDSTYDYSSSFVFFSGRLLFRDIIRKFSLFLSKNIRLSETNRDLKNIALYNNPYTY